MWVILRINSQSGKVSKVGYNEGKPFLNNIRGTSALMRNLADNQCELNKVIRSNVLSWQGPNL